MERDIDWDPQEDPALHTQFLKDRTSKIITFNDSPDVGFEASVNPYRGCEHGCIYCYARPFHEYLGFSAGLDFESKIMVKLDAPKLLREELASPKWKPQAIAMSGGRSAYLQSSPMGYSVYEGLGFYTAERWRQWMPAEYVDPH